MLARDVRLYFTHDVDCAVAALSRDDKGRFAGVAPQATLAAAGWDKLPVAGAA